MLVTVARYSFPYEAHIAKSRLDSEGIPAFIADEHTINMQWLYSDALGGVRLQVPQSYAEQAVRVLDEDREAALIDEIDFEQDVCPQCGSTDIEAHQIGRRWAFLVFLGLDFPLFPVKNGVKCNQCGVVSER